MEFPPPFEKAVIFLRPRRLMGDFNANASFAYAAVFILISVGVLSAVVTQYQNDQRDQIIASREMEEAQKIPDLIASEIELAIHAAALAAGRSHEPPFNLSRFQSSICSSLNRYFNESYPVEVDQFSVNSSLTNISVSLASYSDGDSAGLPVPGSVIVSITCVVSVSTEDLAFSKRMDLSREIFTPVPFFANALDHLDDSSSSEGRLGRIVRGILSQLIQLRVLQGYGSSVHGMGSAIDEILTVEDVELAVNLALLLTEQSIFRTIDQRSWRALQQRGSTSEDTPEDMLSELRGEEIDPFRLFMLLRDCKEPAVELRGYAQQILYSCVDQMVLKYLDYAHLIDIAELEQRKISAIELGWRTVVEFLTGVDTDLERTRKCVEEEFSRLNINRNLWKTIFSREVDLSLHPNTTIVYIYDLYERLIPAAIGTSELSIDLPDLSIMNSECWKNFSYDLSTDTKRIGSVIERLCKFICIDLSGKLPSVRISGSWDDDRALVDLILEALTRELLSLDESELLPLNALSDVKVCDDLLLSLRCFIESSWESIFPFDSTLELGRKRLAAEMAETAIVSDPSLLPDDWKQSLADVILGGLIEGELCDWDERLDWAIGLIAGDCRAIILKLIDANLERSIDEYFPVLQPLFRWINEKIPDQMLLDALKASSIGMHRQIINLTREFHLDERIALDRTGEIRLIDAFRKPQNGSGISISPGIVQDPIFLEASEVPSNVHYSVENIDPMGRLYITLISPLSEGGSAKESVHYTSPRDTVQLPYETSWKARICGAARLTIWDMFDPEAATEDIISIDLELSLSALSGWPLEDVEYISSDSLASDAYALLLRIKETVWEFFSPLIEAYFRAFERMIDSLSGLSKYLLGFAERLSNLFLEFADIIVSKCSEIIDRIQSSPIWKFIEVGIDLLGRTEVKFSYGPMTVAVSCSLPDLLFKKAKDIVRIIVTTQLETLSVAVGFRIAKLSDGSFDIIANSTVRCSLIRLDMRVDPLMKIRNHLFDITARWKGYRLDFWSPEIDDYRQLGVQLSDLPGIGTILSSIPVPALGISISLDAGAHMKYRLPLCDRLSINEVELNPRGSDSGKEWVELYNPLGHEISVEGYTLETVHGKIALIYLSGSVPSSGYRVFHFPKLSLDNGDSSDSFARGDSLILRGSSGKLVDYTPLISDTSNDRTTWQRSWDGAPKWIFKSSTKGVSNGNPLIHTYPDLLAKLCIDALFYALEEELENVSASLGFVKNLLASFLRQLLFQAAEFAASLVYEVTFFIDIGINDLSGSAGMGFRLRITVVGELIRQGILWFAEQISRVFGTLLFNRALSIDLLGDSHPAEAIYIGYEVYARIGLPEMLSPLFKAAELPSDIEIAYSCSMNLATIGALLGREWGDWSILFGIHIDDLPGMSLAHNLPFNRELVDLWLIRGRIRPQ